MIQRMRGVTQTLCWHQLISTKIWLGQFALKAHGFFIESLLIVLLKPLQAPDIAFLPTNCVLKKRMMLFLIFFVCPTSFIKMQFSILQHIE